MLVPSLRARVSKHKSLTDSKYYYQRTKSINSMAEIGRKIKRSREWIRQLMKKQGLTKEEIFLRYK
jgi:hypothetical protein